MLRDSHLEVLGDSGYVQSGIDQVKSNVNWLEINKDEIGAWLMVSNRNYYTFYFMAEFKFFNVQFFLIRGYYYYHGKTFYLCDPLKRFTSMRYQLHLEMPHQSFFYHFTPNFFNPSDFSNSIILIPSPVQVLCFIKVIH